MEIKTCKKCGRIREDGPSKKCAHCRLTANEAARRWHRDNSFRAFKHYGNKCAQCNESNTLFLTIDHINGGGTKEKKELGLYGDDFYEWLKQRDFPEGYQTLCMNCNTIKSKPGFLSDGYYEAAKEKVYEKILKSYGFEETGCFCCGFTNLKGLSIDHIKNDGNNDRKKYGSGLGQLNAILRGEIIIEDNLQILCMNCNIGKMRNKGQCPHKGIVDRNQFIPPIENKTPGPPKGTAYKNVCNICGAPRTTPISKGLPARCEKHKWLRKNPRKPSEGREIGDLRIKDNRSREYNKVRKDTITGMYLPIAFEV